MTELFTDHLRTKPVRFAGMPEGEWRIVWHGDVGFPLRHATWSQPTINVVLQSERQHERPPISASFPIAQLWGLKLGSVWRDTELCAAEQWGIDREFTFATGDVSSCFAGVPLTEDEDSKYLIPFGQFDWHRDHTRAHCLRVKVENIHVILPAVEVIRFYFGSSGKLLKCLFSSDFALEDLSVGHSIHNGVVTVELAPDVPRASGVDIARIQASESALRAARCVGRSLAAGASDQRGGRSTYVKASLPFSGRTTLRVRGFPLTAEDGQGRFLVTEIHTCSARLPWTKLCVVSTQRRDSSKTSSTEDAGLEVGPRDPRVSASRRSPGREIDPREASSRSNKRLEAYGRPMRFTDLIRKPVMQLGEVRSGHPPSSTIAAAEFDSTGDGGSAGSRGRRVELILSELPDLASVQVPVETWLAYFEFLGLLQKEAWIHSIQYVHISTQAFPHFVVLPWSINVFGDILPESHGDSSDETIIHTLRCASFANLTLRNVPVAIASISPSPVNPRQEVLVWVGVRMDSFGALQMLREGLTASGIQSPVKLPLECLGHISVHCFRAAAAALLRCVRAWERSIGRTSA